MFFSVEQIAQSIGKLATCHVFFGTSFLAFKKNDLPVGSAAWVVFTTIANDLLNTYYKPAKGYDGYYHPFATADKEQRWHPPRYGSTSLQRITTDTFRDAFIHEKNKSEWGWVHNYVPVLKAHKEFAKPIPAFDLAVWLFREWKWPARCQPREVVKALFAEFGIKGEEESLFDTKPPGGSTDWLVESPVTEEALLDVIGFPPGFTSKGARLLSLDMVDVGPGKSFRYEPSERLNIITGDNSLGKTFILDCAWWALTKGWAERPIIPLDDELSNRPRIGFAVGSSETRRPKSSESIFDRRKQDWTAPKVPSATAGLVVFARFDGSFAIWDSALAQIHADRDGKGASLRAGALLLSRKEVWDGLPRERSEATCNGLLRDWIVWKTGGSRHGDRWELLCDCLETLSPSKDEKLRPGEPTQLPFYDIDIPTLQMPRGEVPILYASAGVQRVIALAYALVWSWFRHQEYSRRLGEEVKRQLILILDEAEAHLHPRWQRVIVPAIMQVLEALAPVASPQIHLATHSPMVMASAETVFDDDRDALHHLKLADGAVMLERLDFVKRGRADLWLMSDVFGLPHARSLEGEQAIEDAKAIQLRDRAPIDEVREVHKRLLKYLANDDDFWPRWRYFALQHGVER